MKDQDQAQTAKPEPIEATANNDNPPANAANITMESQSSVVLGLNDKGLQMKDCKIYGASVDEIFDNQEQAIRRYLKLKADHAAGGFNPEVK